MSVEQLENMYPVIWTLVNDFQTAASSRLFVQCLKFKSIDRSNASFKSIFGFLSRLIQAQQDATYKGRFKLEEAEQEATLDWILMLPRKIWEIKASDSELTGVFNRVFDKRKQVSYDLGRIGFSEIRLSEKSAQHYSEREVSRQNAALYGSLFPLNDVQRRVLWTLPDVAT